MSRQWLDDDHTGLRDYPNYRRGMRSDPSISPLTRGARRLWASVYRVLAWVFSRELRGRLR